MEVPEEKIRIVDQAEFEFRSEKPEKIPGIGNEMRRCHMVSVVLVCVGVRWCALSCRPRSLRPACPPQGRCPQPRHLGGNAVRDESRVLFGGETAQAEPDGRPDAIRGEPERREHVRG